MVGSVTDYVYTLQVGDSVQQAGILNHILDPTLSHRNPDCNLTVYSINSIASSKSVSHTLTCCSIRGIISSKSDSQEATFQSVKLHFLFVSHLSKISYMHNPSATPDLIILQNKDLKLTSYSSNCLSMNTYTVRVTY